MLETLELTCETYLKIFQDYKSHENIRGGTIWQFLTESHIKYYGGKCPVYCIIHTHNNQEIEIKISGTYEALITHVVTFSLYINIFIKIFFKQR